MTYKIVILSARASNLVSCIQSVLKNEPDFPPDHIIVVDDGARAKAEPLLPQVKWVSGIKPFIFARNANIGIDEAASDVILLNDDAQLVTPRGFTLLATQVNARPNLGICSPGIHGVIGNANQRVSGRGFFRSEANSLAFVCVYITRSAIEKIGPLDERFVGYGFEDNDYCSRARAAGYELGIWDGCVINHTGALPSTFRTRSDLSKLFYQNRNLFTEKWKNGTPSPVVHHRAEPAQVTSERSVDLLYLACNRLEFTKETFTALVANTDWQHIRELVVIDDGSTDGTREWLGDNISKVSAPVRLLHTQFGSPVTAMTHFIKSASAPMLAKTDNDAMLPPGWLRQSLKVMDSHNELTMLGIEAMYPHDDNPNTTRSYTKAEFISGLGLYRREAFAQSQPSAYKKYFGLEEWQMARSNQFIYGWITPAMPVFLLDRFPFDPWRKYSDEYINRGWQRPWPGYPNDSTLWRWRWPASPYDPSITRSDDARFLCAMRIKNEAAHIHEALSRAFNLCSRAYVFDDHSTDETIDICRSFGERVTIFHSPFDGFDEARDKNYLLGKVIEANPEWVMWIDGDEVLEVSGPDKIKAATVNSNGIAAYQLKIAYLWNDPQHVRVDGIFGRFLRPSVFKLGGQIASRLHFPVTGFGGNLHCGNVPRGLLGSVRPIDVRLKHYSLMLSDIRQAKYEWYNRIDPNNVVEDNYRHLIEIPGAKHAPGPPKIEEWKE
jgi:GT2 family glycosyltransferase